MFLVDLSRGFLSGLSPSDLFELVLAALLVGFAFFWRSSLQARLEHLAEKTRLCMLLLGLLPVGLRLLLLPNHPVPSPDIYDEFSHLLAADTLLHFRLANPPHPLHQFFETFFVLQQPTYSSIYPLGQGLILAFGRIVSGIAWTGVVISVAAFCVLCYWMLRAWTTPGWALLGGLLAVMEFGPLNLWMNCYWGGALAAAAGCLVFGALPRLRNFWRTRDAALLSADLAIHLLTRPFESTLLLLSVILFFIPVLEERAQRSRAGRAAPFWSLRLAGKARAHPCLSEFLSVWRRGNRALCALRNLDKLRTLARIGPVVIVAVLPAVLLTLLQNKQVTHNWATPPYLLSQYQYGVPATLTIQQNATPHVPLTPQQALDYKAQALTHGPGTDTIGRFLQRLEYRIRYYRFFFLPALYIALFAFFFAFREREFVWIIGTLAIFAFGTNLFPYLLVHYLAAVTCLFVLVSVIGLKQLSRLNIRSAPAGIEIVQLIVFLCTVHFLVWYSLHLFENRPFSLAMMRYETWDAINHRGPERRIAINRQLAGIQVNCSCLFIIRPNISFRTSGCGMLLILTLLASSGRAIWGRSKTKNFAITTLIEKFCCWSRTFDLHGSQLMEIRQ
jgi:hypothetical protein